MKDLRIGVMGCGNMGKAIVKGLVSKGIVPAGNIMVNDRDESRSSAVSAMFRGVKRGDVPKLMASSRYILLAVKPQDSQILLEELCGYARSHVFISIMAGITIGSLNKRLGPKVAVVRAMPNMAARIGESVTAVSFNKSVKNTRDIKLIFSSIGDVVEVKENQMDTVTAVSGSGPAYLFYLAEAMIRSAERHGIKGDSARRLVTQTLYGASALLRAEAKTAPGELVAAVASKGGTTERALAVFEEKEMAVIIDLAISMAKKRSGELSKG
ncbi:MAG TPA: pyrroline-5-carboxylate reductase [Candidatus Omnitrophota bacterium]|nr:pyrroline-5-carboxylate reductase [Candidatus Omnitrophota bacterium]HPS20015.1 pyrroline-5-carboxylate reductase [Candidatus Omnitrophota bacterium]